MRQTKILSTKIIIGCVLASTISISAAAQGRVVMMNTWADSGDKASKSADSSPISSNSNSAYLRAVEELDSLQQVVLELKQELNKSKRENEALLSYNRELVQGKVQESRVEREQAVANVIDEEALHEAITFEDCMEATSFQPLFSEIIEMKYTLDKKNNSFKGQLIHTYTPEIGQREVRTQDISGSFERLRDQLSLHIEKIDLIPTDITFCVHDKSYRSFIKAGPDAAVLPYTKVVDFEELNIGYCLF